ncbi:MAG: selenocysteine-specific translation elongation factor [Jatrophihabitans sp.]|uniref:selenocysteine-specific translation elongation factor n=1 Tax=Jatrophihabitans sp. TaxID=1932789 RepID=UPI003F822F84
MTVRVVATAGHVDHGKSTLVRALTGMEPDRWAEERRRGMTIDLGYAWTTLPSGAGIAFVDVPGHQRFIANMLAGLGPVPAVLFVVAADEGWSRQSEEHLAAADALAVRHGVLAVTRSDLADPAPALEEARARLARSSLGEVDAVTVSGATGAGLDELRTALDRLVATLPVPDARDGVRLWIDRSFTVRGSGTVVTGTLAAGRVAAGDTLLLGDRPVAVRALQSLGTSRETVEAPARVALNLRNIARDEIGRGDALVTPSAWPTPTEVDVLLARVDEVPTELMLHLGTAALPVRVRPLARDDRGLLARLRLPRAVPVRAGDRAVLRDPGQQAVAAGVLVLDADPPPLNRRGAAASRAAALMTADGRVDPAVELVRRGAMPQQLLRRLAGRVEVSLPGLVTHGDWLIAPWQWSTWRAAVGETVPAWAKEHPLDPAMPLPALARALGLPDASLAAPLAEAADLQVGDGRVRAPVEVATLGAAEESVRTLEHRLATDPFAAPEAYELADLRLGHRELSAAARAGRLLRLGDIVLLPTAVDEAARRLAALPQPFTTSQARQALGTSRRVAIPLLEQLDRLGRTERVDAATRRVR